MKTQNDAWICARQTRAAFTLRCYVCVFAISFSSPKMIVQFFFFFYFPGLCSRTYKNSQHIVKKKKKKNNNRKAKKNKKIESVVFMFKSFVFIVVLFLHKFYLTSIIFK